jgi:CRISPR-associated protein Csd1
MLATALAQFADDRLAAEMADAAFEEKPVAFLLELAPDGRFLGLRTRTVTDQRGKKTHTLTLPLRVPKSPVNRNSGLHPLLAADDIKYVLGPLQTTAEEARANQQERYESFVTLLRRAARETGDTGLASAVVFYDDGLAVEAARLEAVEKKAVPGNLVAISVRGPLVERPPVRDWWVAHYRAAFASRMETGATGMCLISGRTGPIAPTHDKIKGLASLGGQAAGVALMSFDKDAFQSYGWQQNANSPVIPDRAAAYVLALNYLLKPGSPTRRDHAGAAFVFWTRLNQENRVRGFIEAPDPEEVRKLLALDSSGLIKSDEFYFISVAANGGRLVLRDWLHDSLDRVIDNVRSWHRDLAIVNVFTGECAEPPPLWKLLSALTRPGEEAPPATFANLLMARALRGQPIGDGLLGRLLERMRRAGGSERLRPDRAALLRLSLKDHPRGGYDMTESLDVASENRAYLCGRLLAVYDGLQYAAQGDINNTVADRFYSLASTNPEIAFPKIANLGQAHLRKLRRDKRGAMVRIEREIQALMSRIESAGRKFPGALSMADQGSFVLGFHHQKAESYRQAIEKKQEKNMNTETNHE